MMEQGLFEDVQALSKIENKELEAVKTRNTALANELQRAVDCIQMLKQELFKVEDTRRAEIKTLERENAQMRTAFALVSETAKRLSKEKAAEIRWKTFYKRDMEAAWFLYQDAERQIKEMLEESKKAKVELKTAERKPLFIAGEKPIRMAACIAPAVGK